MNQVTTFDSLIPESAAIYDFAGCETVKFPESPIVLQDFIAAAYVTNACMIEMAALLKRTRGQVNYFAGTNPEANAAISDIREGHLDLLEKSTVVSALKGDPVDRRYILNALGRERGYGNGPSGETHKNVEVNITIGGGA